MTVHHYDLVITGAGPAGMTAALYGARALLRTVVLERGEPGGELLNTEYLENFISYPKVLGRDLAAKFAAHAREAGAELLEFTGVDSVSKRSDGMFETVCENGDVYVSPAVIVTAGGTPVKLGIPGELEYAGRGVSYCAVCDANFFKGHHIAVVGGGDAAVEESGYLTGYGSKVTLIHRRSELRASKILQQRLFDNPKISVIWNTVAEEVLGENGLMTGLRLRNVETGATQVLDATGLFVFVGFKPNTGIIRGHLEHDVNGYVITDMTMMSPSVPGLFVAGDMRAQLTRQVTTAAGDGTTAAVAAEKYVKAFMEAKREQRSAETMEFRAVEESHAGIRGLAR
ncbi:MAG: FAD-dependent oxidoreductase [Gemmatimonadaceae bacterium]|nr:FAD-dependent oxidoreductase [Gemmatimonadaceae bacterium]